MGALTFARSLFDCQHLHAAHPGLLHGGGGARAAGQTGIQPTRADIRNKRRLQCVSASGGDEPAMGQEAAADVARAVAARGRTRHPVRLAGLPDELRPVDVAVLLPLGRQGAARGAAVGGVLPGHVTLSVTARHRTPGAQRCEREEVLLGQDKHHSTRVGSTSPPP